MNISEAFALAFIVMAGTICAGAITAVVVLLLMNAWSHFTDWRGDRAHARYMRGQRNRARCTHQGSDSCEDCDR